MARKFFFIYFIFYSILGLLSGIFKYMLLWNLLLDKLERKTLACSPYYKKMWCFKLYIMWNFANGLKYYIFLKYLFFYVLIYKWWPYYLCSCCISFMSVRHYLFLLCKLHKLIDDIFTNKKITIHVIKKKTINSLNY